MGRVLENLGLEEKLFCFNFQRLTSTVDLISVRPTHKNGMFTTFYKFEIDPSYYEIQLRFFLFDFNPHLLVLLNFLIYP